MKLIKENLIFFIVSLVFLFYAQSQTFISFQINNVLISILVVVLLLATLVRYNKVRFGWSDLLCLLLIAGISISFFLNVNPITDIVVYTTYISAILFYWVFKPVFFKHKNNPVPLFIFYVKIFYLIVFLQIANIAIRSAGADFAGNFFNTGVVSAFFSVCLPVLLYDILNSKTKTDKTTSVILVVMITGYFLVFKSRNGLLTEFTDVLLLGLISRNYRRTLAWFAISGVNFCALALYVVLKKHSIEGRLLVWEIILNKININWMNGFGMGNFKRNYVNAQSLYINSSNLGLVKRLDLYDHAYNDYIQVFYENGIFTFLTYIFFYFALPIRVLLKSLLPAKEKSALILVVVNYAITSFTFYNFYSFPTHLIYIIFLSLVYSQQIGFEKIISNIRIFILPLIIVLLLAIDYLRLLFEWREAYISYNNSKNDYLQKYAVLNETILQKEPYFVFNYGAILYNSGNPQKTVVVFNKLKRYKYPNPDFYLILGSAYMSLENYPDAQKSYIAADSIFKNNIKLKKTIKNLSIKINDMKTYEIYENQIIYLQKTNQAL